MKYERVHTVQNYWDGPIEGVADYLGVPHKYKLLFDENNNDYSAYYELKQISAKEFDLTLQSWSLWIKWNGKKHKTKEEFNSHPVLPNNRIEYEKIEDRLKKLSELNNSNKFRVKGVFNRLNSDHHNFKVHWKAVE